MKQKHCSNPFFILSHRLKTKQQTKLSLPLSQQKEKQTKNSKLKPVPYPKPPKLQQSEVFSFLFCLQNIILWYHFSSFW